MTAKKKTEKVNPYDKGVTYEGFLIALGDSSIDNYLKGICSEDQITWIKTEIENFKKLKTK